MDDHEVSTGETPQIMEMDDSPLDTSSIPSSQEAILLTDTEENVTVIARTDIVPEAPNESGHKPQAEKQDGTQGDSGKTEEPEVTNSGPGGTKAKEPKNRNRSSGRRRIAKQNRRLLEDVNGTVPPNSHEGGKRGRQSGETPPSAGMPQKKVHKLAATPLEAESNVQGRLKQIPKLTGATKVNFPEKPIGPPSHSKNQSNEQLNGPIKMATRPGITSSTPAKRNPIATAPNNEGPTQEVTSEIKEQPEAGTSRSRSTYADVAKEELVTLAIIDSRKDDGYAMMSQIQYSKLQGAINSYMLQQLEKGGRAPIFEESRLAGGTMRVRCAVASKMWLESHIPRMETRDLWPGAQLMVTEFSRIPKPFKYNAWFPGMYSKPRDIFRMLELKNQGINTKGWSVVNHESKRKEGTNMIIGVDHDSFRLIKIHNGLLFCGIGGKASFKLVKGSIPKATACSTNGETGPSLMQLGPPLQGNEDPTIETDEYLGNELLKTKKSVRQTIKYASLQRGCRFNRQPDEHDANKKPKNDLPTTRTLGKQIKNTGFQPL